MTEKDFRIKLIEFFESDECKVEGYSTVRILQMINQSKDAIELVKGFMNNPKPSGGFRALKAIKRLDLSLEAYILERPEIKDLFNADEKSMAIFRLKEAKYTLKV
jgi:hypothetical protein